VGAVEAVDQLVGADLRRRVGRLGLERVVFGDRHALRGAVHLAGRRVQHVLDLRVERGLGDVECAHHVGLHEVACVEVRVGDRDQGAEMEDPLDAADRSPDGLHVAQIAEDDLHLGHGCGVVPLQRAAVVARVVADEGSHARSGPHQARGQMAADEAARARDDDASSGGAAV